LSSVAKFRKNLDTFGKIFIEDTAYKLTIALVSDAVYQVRRQPTIWRSFVIFRRFLKTMLALSLVAIFPSANLWAGGGMSKSRSHDGSRRIHIKGKSSTGGTTALPVDKDDEISRQKEQARARLIQLQAEEALAKQKEEEATKAIEQAKKEEEAKKKRLTQQVIDHAMSLPFSAFLDDQGNLKYPSRMKIRVPKVFSYYLSEYENESVGRASDKDWSMWHCFLALKVNKEEDLFKKRHISRGKAYPIKRMIVLPKKNEKPTVQLKVDLGKRPATIECRDVEDFSDIQMRLNDVFKVDLDFEDFDEISES